MTLNVPMLRRLLRRVSSRGAPDIKSLASKEWVLCPEEKVTVAPAIYLDGALEKIKGVSPWRTLETDLGLVRGGVVHHAASRAHVIPRVELVGAFLYSGAARAQPGFGKERFWLEPHSAPVMMESAHLVGNWAGSCYFGNYLLDDFPLGLIAEHDPANISIVTKHYEHERGYRDLLRLPRPCLISRGRFDRLTIYTDFAQNSYKEQRYRELRSRMRRALSGSADPAVGVFIRRGRDGEPRTLANETNIATLVSDLGFEIIDTSRMNAHEIARKSFNARIVLGVEGSHLSHAIYTAADDAAFVVMQPPNRFAMAYKEFTDRVDMKFAFVVGEPADVGFTVSLDDLQRTLERVM